MWTQKVILSIAVLLVISSCKIKITVPEGGRVVALSGAYTCEAGETCVIDVIDAFFDETFDAKPAAGFTFAAWRKKDLAFCGGDNSVCQLSTAEFPGTPLMQFLESEKVFYLEPVFGRSNTWETRADSLLAGVSAASCTVRGKLYVFGLGWGAPDKIDQFSEVEEYNPATDSWRKRAKMPTSRAWATASVVNNKCYVIGGVERFYAPSPITTVEEYDPAENSWRAMRPLPKARWGAGSATVNGKIYVVGGTDIMSWSAAPIPEVAIFDPVTNQWSNGSNMLTPRLGPAVATIGKFIYAAGGSNVPDFEMPSSDILERYDPATNKWKKGLAKMPQKVNLSSSSVLNGRLYVMGGMIGSGDETAATTQRYDATTDKWGKVVEMSESRYGLVSEAIDGQIFAMGGRPLRESPALSLTEAYTP